MAEGKNPWEKEWLKSKAKPPWINVRNNQSAGKWQGLKEKNNLGIEGNRREDVRITKQTGGMGRWMLRKNTRTARSRIRWKEWKRLARKITLNIRRKSIKSTEWPASLPNMRCTLAQTAGESEASMWDKRRDWKSAGLHARGRDIVEIYENIGWQDPSKNSLEGIKQRTRFGTLLIPSWDEYHAINKTSTQELEINEAKDSKTLAKPELLLWRCRNDEENQAYGRKRLHKYLQGPIHQSKSEHGDDALIAKAKSLPRNPGTTNALFRSESRTKLNRPWRARGSGNGHVDLIRKQTGTGNS